jgi:hypothetical protein
MALEATLDSHLYFPFQYTCGDLEEVCDSIRYGMGANGSFVAIKTFLMILIVFLHSYKLI